METKSTTLVLRLTPSELALIKATAKKKDQRQATWARDTLIRAAKRETSK